jgi:phage tail-like protein
MVVRDDPLGAFNFLVRVGDAGGDEPMAAGFSDVSGLGGEIQYAEYRNGNDPHSHPRKVATTSRTDDVVLRRGLIGDLGLFAWLRATQDGQRDPRTVTITLLDESRAPACIFVLHGAQPRKWVGPALSAKGGGEVAMEELHLVAERIEFRSGG